MYSRQVVSLTPSPTRKSEFDFDKFLETPVKINRKEYLKSAFSTPKKNNIKARQISTPSPLSPSKVKSLNSPKNVSFKPNPILVADRLRARRFENGLQAQEVRSNRMIEQSEQEWASEERYREHQRKIMMARLSGTRKATQGNRQRDKGILEEIVLERNAHHMECMTGRSYN